MKKKDEKMRRNVAVLFLYATAKSQKQVVRRVSNVSMFELV
jgi:hypothetical protein